MKYYIETELPDGFHWFAGFKVEKIYNEKLGKYIDIPMNLWTTYKEHALPMDSRDKAEEINMKILPDASAKVVNEEVANFKYSFVEVAPNIFHGAKRQCNLQVGDLFKIEPTCGHYFKAVKVLEETGKMICKRMSERGAVGLTETFSLKSKRFIHVIYDARKKKIQSEQDEPK